MSSQESGGRSLVTAVATELIWEVVEAELGEQIYVKLLGHSAEPGAGEPSVRQIARIWCRQGRVNIFEDEGAPPVGRASSESGRTPIQSAEPGDSREELARKLIRESPETFPGNGESVQPLLTSAMRVTDTGSRVQSTFDVWRFFSDCQVSVEERTGRVKSWYINAFADGVPGSKVSRARAILRARRFLEVDVPLRNPTVRFEKVLDSDIVTVSWSHEIEGLPVLDDHVSMMLNAISGQVFSYAAAWREVADEVLDVSCMSEEEALKSAETERTRFGIPEEAEGRVRGKAILEVTDDSEDGAIRKDHLVWRIDYRANDWWGHRLLSLDATTGDVLRVEGY